MERQGIEPLDRGNELASSPTPPEWAEVTHDLNNVFTTVLASVELLDRSTTDPSSKRRLASIRLAVEDGVAFLMRLTEGDYQSRRDLGRGQSQAPIDAQLTEHKGEDPH